MGRSCIFVFEMDLKRKKFNYTFIVDKPRDGETLHNYEKNVNMYTVACISYKSVY